jgi:pimeloyl-ACP methyl ester carboxylesterase
MLSLLCNARTAAALALAVIVCALAAHADTVILKDGYTIHGVKLVKEKDVIVDDKTGMPFIFDKPNGLVAVDDGPRLVAVPYSPTQIADVNDNNRFRDFAAYTRDRDAGTEKLPSTAREATVEKDWDPKEWTRIIRFQDVDPRIYHKVYQHINVITPHYVRIGSKSHRMARYFLLKEFKPDFIRKLLVNHPDLVEAKGKPDPDRRERLIRFWVQADWLDEADKDLDRLLADLPAEKPRYTRLKAEVNALRAEKLMAEIERARDSGRHHWAIQTLAAFPKEDVPKSVGTKVTTLRVDYEKRTARFDAARRSLDDLTKRANAANPWLIDAAKAVRAEVHLDTLSRLDMFVTLAERAEKDAKEGRRPSYSAEELLAAAVTGWHLGKVGAEPKVGSAYKCWMTRQMALDYLRSTVKGDRQRILNGYLGGPNALAYDELEKLVSLLPPPDAPAESPKGMVKYDLVPTVAYPNGVSFVVRLPEEYQPGRSYPLLVLLADPALDGSPEYLLERFGDLPARHGYIVAAAQWWDPLKKDPRYTYTAHEQGTVLQLLRHLRRAFQVDADRVFLWGNGEGGSMALDLGASHPDLFAGVVPVNPSVYQPLYIPAEYWVNFHLLPVYMILGDTFGPSVNAIRMMSERWMPRGFPALVVSYKGRGQEWFTEELPYAFDWMGRKRRADPGKMVGPPGFADKTVPGFSTVRLTDNRFHWLSSDDIRSERTMNPVLHGRMASPAKFSARVLEGNSIELRVTGLRQVTVWFGKGTVDYTKPVTVKVDRTSKPVTRTIAPEIPVLMEDLYERGDRQRPYFARMDFKVPG